MKFVLRKGSPCEVFVEGESSCEVCVEGRSSSEDCVEGGVILRRRGHPEKFVLREVVIL